jgi:hypothetical protein
LSRSAIAGISAARRLARRAQWGGCIHPTPNRRTNMKTTSKKKLALRRENLRTLSTNELAQVGGASLFCPPPVLTQNNSVQTQYTSYYTSYSGAI